MSVLFPSTASSWGVVNGSSPLMQFDPVRELDSYFHSSLGPYHPQSIFAYYWILLCNTFSSYAIITYGSFICQAAFYFGFALPSLLFPFLPFMAKYKIQSNREWTWSDQWIVFKRVGLAKFGIYLPLAMFGYWFLHRLSISLPYTYETMPNWYELSVKVFISLIIEDTWHYWLHRLLHHPSLYGYVHKVHHQFSAPFALTAEYAHPIETIVLGFGFFIPVFFFGTHLIYFWYWLLARMCETLDVHSGYNVWWFNLLNPLHYLPFYGGSKFHDFHHKRFDVNYASTFVVWDWLCGTDQLYRDAIAAEKEGMGLQSKKGN